MGELELRDLDADKESLTEMARQVLRDEMKKRGLERPSAAGQAQTMRRTLPNRSLKRII